jgi:5'(3')-deoxyribonucleotidase
MSKEGGGLRFNTGKTRYDLIPAFAQEQYARVLSKGAEKYADRNWEKGMPWSKVAASLERHLYAFKRGEDYDPETGLLHMAHVMCNAAFLTEYYKIFPKGDDRIPGWMRQKRIGMDIDDVLASFLSAFSRRFDMKQPENWNFQEIVDHYDDLEDHFFENLGSVIHPTDLGFEPTVYITSRPEKLREPTEKWLFKLNKYPLAPVIFTTDKAAICAELNLDAFVDDKFDSFVKINKAGTLCYLFDAPHNRKYDVGHKRITRETINSIL